MRFSPKKYAFVGINGIDGAAVLPFILRTWGDVST